MLGGWAGNVGDARGATACRLYTALQFRRQGNRPVPDEDAADDGGDGAGADGEANNADAEEDEDFEDVFQLQLVDRRSCVSRLIVGGLALPYISSTVGWYVHLALPYPMHSGGRFIVIVCACANSRRVAACAGSWAAASLADRLGGRALPCSASCLPHRRSPNPRHFRAGQRQALCGISRGRRSISSRCTGRARSSWRSSGGSKF